MIPDCQLCIFTSDARYKCTGPVSISIPSWLLVQPAAVVTTRRVEARKFFMDIL